MSDSLHANLHEIRHIERGSAGSLESIARSGSHLINQAATNKNRAGQQTKWLQPLPKPITPIDTNPSSIFVFRRPPPERRLLLQTLPPLSPTHALHLLDWGTPATAQESLGISGLDEFVSGVDWIGHRTSVVPPMAKRRHSTDESEPLAHLLSTKRVCLPLVKSGVSEQVSAPSSSSSSPRHALATLQATARFRLGLRKRPAVGQKRPTGGSSNVNMTPKRQLGLGPPRILNTDDDSKEMPMASTSITPAQITKRPLAPSRQTIVEKSRKGVVLVPSSQSPDAADTPASLSRNSSWTHNRMATSVSYDSSPDASPDRTAGTRSAVQDSARHDTTRNSQSPVSTMPCHITTRPSLGRMVPSSSPEQPCLKLTLTESPKTSELTTRQTERPSTEASSTGRPDNQLIASVMYDSSQGSNSSRSGEHSKSHTSYGSLVLPASFDDKFLSQNTNVSESWNLSQAGPADSWIVPASEPMFQPPHREKACVTTASDPLLQSRDPPSPERFPSGLDIISALYDSSQDDFGLGRSQGKAANHAPPHEPMPSWSTCEFSQSSAPRLLSGARPSGSWSIPSVEGLVAASRSLSLEDFENRVRRSPNSQQATLDEQPQSETYSSSHQLGQNLTKSIVHATPLMHPEVSRLASYLSAEDSIESITPSLPEPSTHLMDDTIESINSPLPDRVPRDVKTDRLPAFRMPRPELEDDISLESQQARTLSHCPPAPPINPDSPPEMIDSSTSDQRISVPRFDAVPCSGNQPPRADVSGATSTKITPAQKPSNSVILSTPDRQTLLNDPPFGSNPPLNSKIYNGSLHKVIPQPHLLPSLSGPFPSLAEGMLNALEASSVRVWFDESGNPTSPEDFPHDPWKRAAWVIPVRGHPPWKGCSSAAIFSRPIVKERKKRSILWTPASLRSMWAQLDGFRQSKRIGFLSLSFEPIRTGSQDQAFEFVKVYHDAKVSLKLRTIMKVLEFEDYDGYGVDAEVPQQDDGLGLAGARRLLGSTTRLPLVDETGRIMLIS